MLIGDIEICDKLIFVYFTFKASQANQNHYDVYFVLGVEVLHNVIMHFVSFA